MFAHLVQGLYVLAALLFILALAGLSKHETAERGNVLGMIGMVIALVATVMLSVQDSHRTALVTVIMIIAAMIIGAAFGIWRALRVEMTGMPQLIAMLHSFVGLAAVLVGFNTPTSADSADSAAAICGCTWRRSTWAPSSAR